MSRLILARVPAGGSRVWSRRPMRLDLAPTPAGTRVEARVAGEKVAETVVARQGDKTVYTVPLDRRYAGKRVLFRFPPCPQLGQAEQTICKLGSEWGLALDGMARGACGGGP